MTDTLAAEEDWELLQSFFPPDWEQLAHTTLALKGLRQDKAPAPLLHTLLLHVGCGHSLRETAVRARQAGLAQMSDVALLKRLRKCEAWLHALAVGLWQERSLAKLEPGQRIMRLVDATIVKEPGPTGSQWRIHYSLQVPSLRCDFFHLSPTQGAGTGESFWRFPVQKGEYLIADRGYSITEGIDSVVQAGAYVLVRLNHGAVRLLTPEGARLNLLPRLQGLERTGQAKSWKVQLGHAQGMVSGRVCALRKSQAAIAQSQRKIRQQAQKDGKSVNPETLAYAQYVVVFTTFPEEEFSLGQALQWYRLRWQIELVFKRFKQLAGLGHLPKHDAPSARAWLYGKMLVALLTEKLIAHADALSPWGYEW
jgi:Transposase DDE domain